jgi:hypothetical protein
MKAVLFAAQGQPLASTVEAQARDLSATPERALDAIAVGAMSRETRRP